MQGNINKNNIMYINIKRTLVVIVAVSNNRRGAALGKKTTDHDSAKMIKDTHPSARTHTTNVLSLCDVLSDMRGQP